MSEPFYRREPYRSILVAVLTALLTILGGTQAVRFGCVHVPPPEKDRKDPEKRPDPPPAEDPQEAVAKIVMRGGYCSATVVGPRRDDRRWSLISAAHCHSAVGERVTVILRSGFTFSARVVAIDRKSDCSLLLSDDAFDVLPYARIATDIPEIGSAVFHCGYGVHIPGNREDGTLVAGEDSNGQLRYLLSVSKGDSGGGIFLTRTGELLSPVCCTTQLNRPGYVWGASPRALHKLLSSPTNFLDGAEPIEMPLRKFEISRSFDLVPPIEMPVRTETEVGLGEASK